MKIREIIEYVDAIKPNAFDQRVKVDMLNALEGRLAASVLLLAPAEVRRLKYRWPEDAETEPLVDAPYDDIYLLWLQAKIDELNGEYNKYANTMAIYNEHYNTFVRWFAQLYEPAEGYISEERRAKWDFTQIPRTTSVLTGWL